MIEKKDDRFLKTIKETIKTVVISLLIVIVITQFIARPVRVEGDSMYPNLQNHEVGFSNIFGASHKTYKRFDIVVVYLESQDKYIVKRIIGLPGETIEYRDEQLYIDNKPVAEPFLDTPYFQKMVENDQAFTPDFGPYKIPEEEFFLVGDNRPRSSDSRNNGIGSFHYKNIVSKDVFVLFPLNKIRKVGH